MNRTQKMAWFDLGVAAAALVVTAMLVTHYITRYGTENVWSATSTLGLIAVSGLKWVLFPKSKEEKKVAMDERDVALACRRGWVAFGASFLFVLVFGVVVWLAVGPNNSIRAGFILTLILGMYITAMIADAAIVLAQYGMGFGAGARGDRHD